MHGAGATELGGTTAVHMHAWMRLPRFISRRRRVRSADPTTALRGIACCKSAVCGGFCNVSPVSQGEAVLFAYPDTAPCCDR